MIQRLPDPGFALGGEGVAFFGAAVALKLKSGFAAGGERPILRGMDNPAHAIEEARRAGIDLALLEDNLALPVKERWRLHEEALALVMKLEQAAAKRDEALQPIAGKAR